MCWLYVLLDFVDFVWMFEELIEICDLMFYLMVLYRHLLLSLVIKSKPRGDGLVKGKLTVPFGAPESHYKIVNYRLLPDGRFECLVFI